MIILIQVIGLAIEILTWLIVIKVVLSYFVPPYHQVRMTLDRTLEPLLAPIRRAIPPSAGLDFSSLILILLIRILGFLLTRILISFI